MARLAGILSLGLFVLATSPQASDGQKIKFPVKVDKKGFQAGIWDVGPTFISGQPTKDSLKALADEGVRTVICLRGTDEMNDRMIVPFDEDAYVKEIGLTYIHIPIGTQAEYSPEAIKKFSEALKIAERKGKVLTHCTVAWRASYVWTSYLYRYQKSSLSDAIKVGEAMNMTSDRVSLLLGSNTEYSLADLANSTKSIANPKKPGAGNKLNLTAPKPINAPDEKNFMNFVMWDMGDVLNASQPSEKQLHELAAKGIRTVINIRTEAEMADVKTNQGFDEETLVKSLGMKYVNIPIQSLESFTPDNLAKIAEALSQSEGKTLFHCFTASRTSTIWIAYLVKYYGVPVDEALKHGEAMRYSNVLESFLGKRLVYNLKPKSTSKGECGEGG